jgi:3',5'-cyclic AMP phosphodiesterase CpdA
MLTLLILFGFASANFAVISDVHYDQYYTVGSPTNCPLGSTGMGCCRKWDTPLEPYSSAPKYGTFGCDSPFSLLNIVVEWLALQKLDYLVFLGDVVDHDLAIQNPNYNMEEISTLAKMLKTLPYPTFSVFGNHDGFIIDNLWDDVFGRKWMEDVQELYGRPSNLSNGGYYNTTDKYGTRMIFLNCLGYDSNNIGVKLNMFNQTTWLLDQITDAKSFNQSVYLFTHFGSDTEEATPEYNSMIDSLNYTRITYFSGHSHRDENRLMKNGFFYVHPSIVPDQHFPEMRIYRENEGIITDYEQYGFNLSSLQFEHVYSAKESYNLKDLSTASWEDFHTRMYTDRQLAIRYCQHYNWGGNYSSCPDTLKDTA